MHRQLMNETSPGRTEPDDDALRNQIAALLPDVRGFARFLVRDRVAADDLVQDGLVRALAAVDQFRTGSNLKAWLFTIVRNAFYETARRRKRETRLLSEHESVAEATRPAAEARHELHDLQFLLWTLPPLLREALILVGAQEMTYEEASLICAVPVGTIKARVSRGRTALADALRRAEGHSDAGHDARDT
jgi:RNA polymerase sigma-70 factor (ECF subfamily)